jgi:acyl-CoA synthetase (AMP-forming)/AMP-acid ligase II
VSFRPLDEAMQRLPHHLFDLLALRAERLPGRPAVATETGALSYADLHRQAEAAAAGLAGLGLRKGDRVALLLSNIPEFAIAYFACARLGAIVVPMNTRLQTPELAHILRDSGAAAMVAEPAFWPTLGPALRQAGGARTLIAAGEGYAQEWYRFADLLEASPAALPPPALEPGDLAHILYTSGTTGLPKGAMVTHANAFANCRNCQTVYRLDEASVTLVAVPLFHVTGLHSQLLALMWAGGCTALLRHYKTDEVIRLLAHHRATYFITAPTILVLMLMSPRLGEHDLSSLTMITYGGGPIAPDTVKELKRRFPGAQCIQVYGLTETSSLSTVHPDALALEKATSVGAPCAGVRVRIVDEALHDVPPGAVGEIAIAGPNVVPGYWNNAEATAHAIRDGWLLTGDLGTLDAEGFLYLMDRKKDMISRGGEKVYSKEVEDVLYAHPAVLEAALYGVPDRVFGEVPRAAVVLRPGAAATEDEIRRFCSARVAEYKVPTSVRFVPELPKNPNGKILKRVLTERDAEAR